ncbi:PHF5-like protein [Yamadazyma tenuis ATCC 10573]|uniref:PHF5-like protein n=1 Tax=Candida tenuis (strain ATCC 10573 / BCRC 21748 / CBS 615 / JCM 9827 / NBRC 10315 / NRRL Y-1498 / VKM Y-70) TaxID=590646 RepID=G3B2D8_CANTC|nr:PHF5-like protein [Yamadazyma tenuis ATCC 10573]EGV64651.1 PHF5-like protein [Yamadazyma tenuis ATCC 10573]
MSRHQYDLVQCMKQMGAQVGKVCGNCEGRCPICDSYVKPTVEVRICQECSQGHLRDRCILCGHRFTEEDSGVEAFYCLECVRLEKHREGCPRILNMGSSKSSMIMDKKKVGPGLERLTG